MLKVINDFLKLILISSIEIDFSVALSRTDINIFLKINEWKTIKVNVSKDTNTINFLKKI